MFKSAIGWWVNAIFFLALTMVGALGVTAYSNTTELVNITELVAHTNEVLEQLEATLSIFKDAESSQRGYLLTRNVLYLQPYSMAVREIPSAFSRLRGLIADNPVQLAQLQRLEALGARKLEVMGRTIHLTEDSPNDAGFEAALHLVRTNEGKRIMDAMRGVAREMEKSEEQTLRIRRGEAQARSRTSHQAIIGGHLLMAVIVLLLYAVVLRDIARRRREEAVSRRAQRLESIGLLASGIAHDLNNVLTPVMMGVKLLSRQSTLGDREGLLNTMQSSAASGARLIKQLLAFAGGSEGKRSRLRMAQVMSEIHDILSHTLPKSIELEMQVADDLWDVMGDSGELSQVLMNHCVNARDAMVHGGRLTLRAENAPNSKDSTSPRPRNPRSHVRIDIQDTGCGISEELLERIFDPFFTTKEYGKGTGLGLATSLGIVRAHGGWIHVESEPDRGSCFSIFLPAVEASSTADFDRESVGLAVGSGEVVLIVDDEPALLKVLAATLKFHGYQVLSANDGREALHVIGQFTGTIGVALVDMMMPGMDGPATIRALHRADPRLPIIATSGLHIAGREQEALAAGAVALLPKPYADDQLLLAVRQALQWHAAPRMVT